MTSSLYVLNPEFLAAVEEGLTRRELAERFGVHYHTIQDIARKHHLDIKRQEGSGSPKTKDYSRIIDFRERGWTYQKIGEEVGVTGERVRQILHSRGRSDLCGRRAAP